MHPQGATFVPVKDAESADSKSKRRRLVGRKGVEPPGRIGELISWLAEAGKDDVRYLVLEHPN